MKHFIISYDLRKARNYQPVWSALESWGAVRLLESLWVVSLNSGTAQIRDALQSLVDNDDGVAVIELKPGSDWSTLNAQRAGAAWLTSNIKRY